MLLRVRLLSQSASQVRSVCKLAPMAGAPLLRRAVEDRLQRLGAVRVRRRRLAGLRDPAALGVLPVTAVEEPPGRQARRVDVVEAAGIDADAVRVGPRDVERVHGALPAESGLG